MKKPRCKYTDFSIPVKIYSAKLYFSTYNKNKKGLSKKSDSPFCYCLFR